MTKEYILTFLKKHKKELKEKFGVEKIGLFGSYAKGNATQESDIDLYVVLKERKVDIMSSLWNFLENNLKKRVDVFFYHPKMRKGLKERLEEEVIYE